MKISQLGLPESKLGTSPVMSANSGTSTSPSSGVSKLSPLGDTVAIGGEDSSDSGLAQLPNFSAWDEGGKDGSGVDMRNGGASIVTQFLQSPKNVVRAVTSSATAASSLGVSRTNLSKAQNNPFQKMDSLAAVMGGVSLGGNSAMGGLSSGGAMNSMMGGSLKASSMPHSGSFSPTSERGLNSGASNLDSAPTMSNSGAGPSVVRTSVTLGGETSLSVKKDEGGKQNLMAASSRHGQAQETASKNALENMTAGTSLGDLSAQHGLAQQDFTQNALGNLGAGQQNMDMAGMLGQQSQQAGDMSGLQSMIAQVMKSVQAMEKMKQAQGKAVETQGKATETQGKAVEASGKATDATGQATQANGVTTQATGVSLQATATGMLTAAAAAAASVFGAPAGAALAAAGTAVMAQGTALNGMGVGLQGTGTALQAQGKTQQATGQATQAAGQQTQQVGKTQQDQAKAAEEKAKKEEQMRQQMAKMLAEQAQKLMQQAQQSVSQAVNNFANALKSQEMADKARQMQEETAEKAKEAFKVADDDKSQAQLAGANRKAVDEALNKAFGTAPGTSQGNEQSSTSPAASPSSAPAQAANVTPTGFGNSPNGDVQQTGDRGALGQKSSPAPLANLKGGKASASTSPSNESRPRSSEVERPTSNPLAANFAQQSSNQQGSNSGGGQHHQRPEPSSAPAKDPAPQGVSNNGNALGSGAQGSPSAVSGRPSTGNASSGNEPFATKTGAFTPKKTGLAVPSGGATRGGSFGNQGRFGSPDQMASTQGSATPNADSETLESGIQQGGNSEKRDSTAGFQESEENVTVNLNDLSGSSSGSSGGSGTGGSKGAGITAAESPDLAGLDGLSEAGSGGSGTAGSGSQSASSQKINQQLRS